ncbi:hypothetical protein [Bradyrhizobium sp. SZCCHNR1045]|uniref:hypothetical protein n=1 Tax=Bradyrhizobium sp. SZCCHNR1045 TaxID=3057353 RepID=UPI0029169CF6|nr:hypothetical protein [Bradyrhizobium sp. SZCCHNR1045]
MFDVERSAPEPLDDIVEQMSRRVSSLSPAIERARAERPRSEIVRAVPIVVSRPEPPHPHPPRNEAIGEITDYESLISVCRARADELQLSRSNIDAIAGWADGLAGKILGSASAKRVGPLTLEPLLAALGLKLIAAPNHVTLERHRNQRIPRDARQVRRPRLRAWVDPVC